MSHKTQIESELPFDEHCIWTQERQPIHKDLENVPTEDRQRKDKKSFIVQFMAGEVKHRDLKDHLLHTYQIQHTLKKISI